MSPECFVLMAEMFANHEINVEAIVASVRGDQMEVTLHPEPSPDTPLTCAWCAAVIPTPQEAFCDEVLTGIFDCLFCKEACRDAFLFSE